MRRLLLAIALLTLAAPVAAQVNVGRESVGASSRNLSQLAKGLRITMPAGGYAPGVTISCHVGDTDAGGEEFVAFILQSADASTILAQSAARTDISATTWYEFSGSSLATFQPVGGTAYIIGCASTATSGAIFTQDDAGLEGFASNDIVADVTPLTWGSTPGLASDSVRDYSVYLTATPGIQEIQQVTYATSAVGTSHVINWSPTPTDGNLLAACIVSDNTVTTPAGWTQAVDASDFSVNRIIYKVASGEGATTTVATGSGHVAIVAFEFAGTATTTPLDQTASAAGQGQNVSTGTTASTTVAQAIALACVGISGGTPTVGSGWNNSFVQQADNVTTGTGTLVRAVVATKLLSATGTVTTTLGLSGAGNGHNGGMVAVFKGAEDEEPPAGVAVPQHLTLIGVGP